MSSKTQSGDVEQTESFFDLLPEVNGTRATDNLVEVTSPTSSTGQIRTQAVDAAGASEKAAPGSLDPEGATADERATKPVSKSRTKSTTATRNDAGDDNAKTVVMGQEAALDAPNGVPSTRPRRPRLR